MAVIDNLFWKRTQGVLLGLFLICVQSTANPSRGCEVVLAEIHAKGFQTSNVNTTPKYGELCGAESCCDSTLEQEMVLQSKQQINKFIKESINRVSSQLDMRAKRFDEFFRDMMNKSKKEFHEMFQRTYGMIYLKNSQVFMDLFAELESYYNKGNVKLSDTMDNFFSILYQKMFTVINAQYQFDEKYLSCVAEHMVELKPFGDVPQKLSMQLRRSFVATRTFYKSLSQGAVIAQNMMKLKTSHECGQELTKMQYCGTCTGKQGAGACLPFCKTVLSNCLRQFTLLSKHWDEFVEAVDKVGDRLLGPFNIEMVVEPINIKISEAIMNFQESGADVSQKVFAGCGNPQLDQQKKRRRRSSPEPRSIPLSAKDEISFESLNFPSGKKKHGKKVESVPTLDKLIKEIKAKVKEMKQFWFYLPYQFCNNPKVVAPTTEPVCWNGTQLSTYEPPATTAAPSTSPILQEQIFTLQVWSGKLQSAYQGQEVDLADDSEETILGSGSGSGDHEDEDELETDPPPFGETKAPTEKEIPSTTSPRPPDVPRASSGSLPTLPRALASYLIPIVLVWFGGTIADLL